MYIRNSHFGREGQSTPGSRGIELFNELVCMQTYLPTHYDLIIRCLHRANVSVFLGFFHQDHHQEAIRSDPSFCHVALSCSAQSSQDYIPVFILLSPLKVSVNSQPLPYEELQNVHFSVFIDSY